jgi:hypothetical protein
MTLCLMYEARVARGLTTKNDWYEVEYWLFSHNNPVKKVEWFLKSFWSPKKNPLLPYLFCMRNQVRNAPLWQKSFCLSWIKIQNSCLISVTESISVSSSIRINFSTFQSTISYQFSFNWISIFFKNTTLNLSTGFKKSSDTPHKCTIFCRFKLQDGTRKNVLFLRNYFTNCGTNDQILAEKPFSMNDWR